MMSISQLNNLEQQIDALLRTRKELLIAQQNLRQENELLRKKMGKITRERAVIQERNYKAAVMVKKIIHQLKLAVPKE